MISFRWKYIALPLVFLLLSVGLAIYFFPRLPGEIAYHFKDGLPDRWLSRGVATAWLLVPQFLLTGLGAASSPLQCWPFSATIRTGYTLCLYGHSP